VTKETFGNLGKDEGKGEIHTHAKAKRHCYLAYYLFIQSVSQLVKKNLYLWCAAETKQTNNTTRTAPL